MPAAGAHDVGSSVPKIGQIASGCLMWRREIRALLGTDELHPRRLPMAGTVQAWQ